MTVRSNYAEVAHSLRSKICIRHPRQLLVVQMGSKGDYVPQCNGCVREGLTPVFGEAHDKLERMGNMTTSTSLATRDQRLAALKVQDVKTLLPMGKATDQEIGAFILYCKAVNADPWAKEIYLVKYDTNSPAAIVLALNWYLKRASHNPLYESYESGVVVQRGGQYVDVVGSTVYPGDTLVGGWCRVYKKSAVHPFERRVSMLEYDKHQFGWTKMPATMIEKVAIVQGIRRAFPDEFAEAGSELPVVLEGEVTEVEGKVIPPPAIGPEPKTFCEKHNAPMTLNRYKNCYGHILDGESGPKGGKVWCYGEQAAPTEAPEPAQDKPQAQPGVASAPKAPVPPLPKASQEFATVYAMWDAIEGEATTRGLVLRDAIEDMQKAIGPLGEHMGKGYTRGQYFELAVAWFQKSGSQ